MGSFPVKNASPFHFSQAFPVLYASDKTINFSEFLEIADLPRFVLFRKMLPGWVKFLLGGKREREVRFSKMSILNMISTGRKGVKFSPIFLHSYKRKKTGCICVMCSCLKVVLVFILCTLFWNAVGSRKIRRIMIQW